MAVKPITHGWMDRLMNGTIIINKIKLGLLIEFLIMAHMFCDIHQYICKGVTEKQC